ncbi:MAG TPA: class I SAM-dependent methyltransferase [Anaerolineaceae bacterium]
METTEIKQQVREFYDQVGWQMVSDGVYQNARYEDLRPVAREYIHDCHLRVGRFLKPAGRYLLDAGSGPVQYPEYLTYSQGFAYRVCADISIVALQEARKRIGSRGLYVVADVANLPFKNEAFESIVSLHTLHHLPPQDHARAYAELYRSLAPGCPAVIVNGWTVSRLMSRLNWLVRGMERLQGILTRLSGKNASSKAETAPAGPAKQKPTGTFIQKYDAGWLAETLGGKKIPYEIRCWRSVSVRFLRAVIRPALGGRFWLRLLFSLEERFPRWMGQNGQYPLIVVRKPLKSN